MTNFVGRLGSTSNQESSPIKMRKVRKRNHPGIVYVLKITGPSFPETEPKSGVTIGPINTPMKLAVDSTARYGPRSSSGSV